MRILEQALKYGVVGVFNTLLTAVVIWVMMRLVGVTDIYANAVGYGAGVLNSFVLNRKWTFKQSTIQWKRSALSFLVVFIICYVAQLGLLTYLNATLTIDTYYNQLIAMVFYAIINFGMNKYYTFKI